MDTMATTTWSNGPSRRSERGIRLRTIYSPEPQIKPKTKKIKNREKFARHTQPVAGKQSWLKISESLSLCERCKLTFVRHRKSKRKSSENHTLNPVNVEILCPTCSSAKTKKTKRQKILPSVEDKEKYHKEAQAFALSLAEILRDHDAERLFCPEFKLQPCACLQKFILAEGNIEESHKRGQHLLLLLKEAKHLSLQKCYNLHEVQIIGGKGRRVGCIGMGNGHKRSEQFEKFVLQQRKYLRTELRLCERATQKVLMYSNNFLHKKLKTEPEKLRRVERSKGKAALGLLTSISELPNQTCCIENCVMMAATHGKLLERWRERAALGQAEARRVMAEMLTPSGGVTTNCFKFISLVTGSSHSTIAKVSEQMHRTGGDREPPEHGLRKWWQEQAKKQQNSSGQWLQGTTSDDTGQLLNPLVHSDPVLPSDSSDLQCSLSSSLGAEVVVMGEDSPSPTDQPIGIQNQNIASRSIQPIIAECSGPEKSLETCVMFPVINQAGQSLSTLEATVPTDLASLPDQQLVLEGPNGEHLGGQLLSINIGNILLIQPPVKMSDSTISRISKDYVAAGPSGLSFSGLFTPGPQIGSSVVTSVSNPLISTNSGGCAKNVRSIVLTLNLPKPKAVAQDTVSLDCSNSTNSLLSSTDCTLLRTPL